MKLDMSEAWNQAIRMLAGNRDLIAIVAGVFFFLPYLAVMLMVPDFASEMPVAQPNADPEAMEAALAALFSRIWLPVLLMSLVQAIGSLALLALLRDSTRPTLGEALKLGLVAFLPYVAAQLIVALGAVVVGGALVGGASAINAALGFLMLLLVFAGMVYLLIKVSLTMPVIAIERVYNPLTALTRSWRLTKGNSLRLFFFYFLIAVAGLIVIMVVQMILGLLFAAFGEQGQLIGDGVVASLLNAIWATVMLAVIAAAHHQLAAGGAASDA